MLFQKVVILTCTFQLLTVYGVPTEESTSESSSSTDKLIVTTIHVMPFLVWSPGQIYDGYIPDLMQLISDKTNLSFNLKIVSDSRYGVIGDNGTWNGMVGEVISEVASIAAAPLTVTEPRKQVLDFTVPFMSIHLSMVLLKDTEIKIHNLDDLISHAADVKVGAIFGGSTMNFFQTTQDPILQQVNVMLNSDPSNAVPTSDHGITRVRESNGSYIFITFSDMAESIVGKSPCTLTKIDIIPNNYEYALAVKKGSHLKSILDIALENLRDEGELDMLKKKWWSSECSNNSKK